MRLDNRQQSASIAVRYWVLTTDPPGPKTAVSGSVFGFRKTTEADEARLAQWLVDEVCPVELKADPAGGAGDAAGAEIDKLTRLRGLGLPTDRLDQASEKVASAWVRLTSEAPC